MAQDVYTFGINFPFQDSIAGTYFGLTYQSKDEIRASLLHLLLTQKGTRYYDPDFGTEIYKYIFDPMDGETFENIREEVDTQVKKYIPNLDVTDIKVEPYTPEETDNQDKIKTIDFFNPKELVKDNIIRRRIATQPLDEVTPTEIPGFIISPFSGESFYNYVGQQFEDTDADNDESYTDIFKTPGPNTLDYTAKLTIVYTDNNSPFGSKEFIIINI
jgi:phage baseplate assembly protein W